MDDELLRQAELALSEARRQLEQHAFRPYFLVHVTGVAGGASFERMNFDPDMLNHSLDKRALFRSIRVLVRLLPIDAVILVSDMRMAQLTPAGLSFARDHSAEFQRLAAEPGFATLARRGLVERSDALQVCLQTAAETHWINQRYERDLDGSVIFGRRDTVSSLEEGVGVDGDMMSVFSDEDESPALERLVARLKGEHAKAD